MCILIIWTKFVWNISQSKKKWARYDQKCILVSTHSTHYSCQIWTKLALYGWNFEKFSNIKITKIHPNGADLTSAGGEMDRHNEANSCFLQFCKRAWTLKYFVKHFKHLSKGYNQPLETKINSICQLIVWKSPKIKVLPETSHAGGHSVHRIHLCAQGTQMNMFDLLHYAAEHTGTNFKKILHCIIDNKNLLWFVSHRDKDGIL